ncbi:unnamed protein product [Lathyrus sativus]|nr:unnamed protein product [Lathyrus sativus]
MTMQQYICASFSSSSSTTTSLKKKVVFISFRGEDTRRNFTSHLCDALSKKVLAFIDETELQRGDEISSALIKAIEETVISVVIFLKDYASSKWCLHELVKILECKRDQGQIMILVFYDIQTSHVRNQPGSFKEAYKNHKQNLRHNKDKFKKWKNALIEASNLSGWNSQDYR